MQETALTLLSLLYVVQTFMNSIQQNENCCISNNPTIFINYYYHHTDYIIRNYFSCLITFFHFYTSFYHFFNISVLLFTADPISFLTFVLHFIIQINSCYIVLASTKIHTKFEDGYYKELPKYVSTIL